MKKLAIFVTALMMALSMCACACDNTAPATDPSTNNGTGNTMMPTETMTIPVPSTNIPDPSVDDTMPGGITGGTDATGNQSRSGLNNNMMG